MTNKDDAVVADFGNEWHRFPQDKLDNSELVRIFDDYFKHFPWDKLGAHPEGFDMGCGSGRWARCVAPMVGKLNCIEPSRALEVAKNNLRDFDNVVFYNNHIDDTPLSEGSQDFGYCLGVVHHVPDTFSAIRGCVKFLKPGAPMLFYIYYSFDNRPWWFKAIWKVSDYLRLVICRLPENIRSICTDLIAMFIYFPTARLSKIFNKFFYKKNIPLAYYCDKSMYTMRTDARDRFGTTLEKRFSRNEIEAMLTSAGLTRIEFSDKAPYWCVLGYKK